MTADQFRAAALALLGVEEGFNMGSAVFKSGGKVLARLLGEDQAMLTVLSLDELDVLMAARPDAFHVTPHYQAYPAMLLRLDALTTGDGADFLERRWRQIAPKATIKAFDAARALRTTAPEGDQHGPAQAP